MRREFADKVLGIRGTGHILVGLSKVYRYVSGGYIRRERLTDTDMDNGYLRNSGLHYRRMIDTLGEIVEPDWHPSAASVTGSTCRAEAKNQEYYTILHRRPRRRVSLK